MILKAPLCSMPSFRDILCALNFHLYGVVYGNEIGRKDSKYQLILQKNINVFKEILACPNYAFGGLYCDGFMPFGDFGCKDYDLSELCFWGIML